MLSNKPYLLRAFYQWITDSGCTPILVIDVNHPRCKVPLDYAEGGEIVFNISSVAVRDLKITNELIEFKASFSGVIHMISAPLKAILAIYAEENGEGLFFDGNEDSGTDSDTSDVVQLYGIDGSLSNTYSADAMNKRDIPITHSEAKKPFLKLVE